LPQRQVHRCRKEQGDDRSNSIQWRKAHGAVCCCLTLEFTGTARSHSAASGTMVG
jgi:hypothetical protein